MYVDVKNEDYGYSVATHGKYVAAGNPRHLRYNPLTASRYPTGSVDVFRYDINTDQHFFIETLRKPIYPSEIILLAAESASILSSSLHTETEGYDFVNRDKDIAVDDLLYFTASDDDYGHAVDWYDKKLTVGCRYYSASAFFPESSSTFTFTGSTVDVWDYTYSERNNYTFNTIITMVGYGFTGSTAPTISSGLTSSANLGTVNLTTHNFYYEVLLVPPGYDELWVSMTTTASGSMGVVSKIPVSPDGEFATYAYTSSLYAGSTASYVGVITNQIRYFTIENPDVRISESFGHAVSLNEQWLAIGSPLVSGSKGMVYLYKNQSTGSFLSWSLAQKIESSDAYSGQKYGWDVSLNKSADSACPNRLVVGCGGADNNTVSLYELSASVWIETYQFHQDTHSLAPLTFGSSSYPILLPSSYVTSSFGWSVSTWENTVIIGAPTERTVLEFTGSAAYEQGTAYIFERCSQYGCPVTASDYTLANKIYGDQYTLKNNRVGYSVSVYGNSAVIGVPKRNIDMVDACYQRGAIPQQLYCDVDLEDSLNGQWMYLTKNTASAWSLQKVFQKKKRFMSPYRFMGEDISIGDQSIVVGAPMLISGSIREISVLYTSSIGVALDDIMGKAYIYNLPNYKAQHYVGNVFYRNGTLIVNTSGSAFAGLYFNPTSPYLYEYLLDYKSQHSITEKQIVCTVEPGEFNVSTNPTAVVKASSDLDLNRNGVFDFQDVDVLLRYMQYKNSTTLGGYSFDWSSSILSADDEISFYNYNTELWENTDVLFSSSLKRFETVDTWVAPLLDFNEDNKIDGNDMLILWKYFSNRLTEKNYMSYIHPNCNRQQVSEALIYLDDLSKRNALPLISPSFSDYDNQCRTDRTGSYQSTMVTTIGLYDGLDLVAVAKVGAPIKLPKTLPINFVVKMDF